jgi:hypothetical protein
LAYPSPNSLSMDSTAFSIQSCALWCDCSKYWVGVNTASSSSDVQESDRRAEVLAESCLRILRAHALDGDRFLQARTQALITLDEGVLKGITGEQRHAHAEQLAAMRDGQLRGLPSVFGDLA